MLLIRNCNRCGHDWASRQRSEPIACPACKSRLWNIPRVYRQRDPSGLSRREIARNAYKRLYTFHALEVGQSEKWTFEKGEPFNSRRVRALTKFCHRTGRQFFWDGNSRTQTRMK